MNDELLILFVILLLGLILCSFLGGKGNIEGMENSYYSKTFYGENGASAQFLKNSSGNYRLIIRSSNGTISTYNGNNTSENIYTGPDGAIATIYDSTDTVIKVNDKNGNIILTLTTNQNTGNVSSTTQNEVNNVNTYDSQDDTINQYDADNNTTGTDVSASTYYGPYVGQSTTVSGPSGNTYSTYDSSAYYNSQSNGISRDQIPSGDEDLYILKSQIVPPVCARCPDVIQKCPDNFDATKCPACPACARCPEPSFECKKVPNYNAFNPDTMPVPILSSFSSFGM